MADLPRLRYDDAGGEKFLRGLDAFADGIGLSEHVVALGKDL